MNNVSTVALRSASNCLPSTLCSLTYRNTPSPFTAATTLSYVRRFLGPCRPEHSPRPSLFQRRTFTNSVQRYFRPSAAVRILKPYEYDGRPERGLKFDNNDLSKSRLIEIFGRSHPPSQYANRLLRLLHARRVDGTLDVPLPEEVEEELTKYPNAVEDGLQWLRKAYPVDEDAAIMARIDREEDRVLKDNPSELVQRGQDLGLYKGPQSGYYDAELSEKEGDVYGRSEIDRIRAEHVAEIEREERELQEQVEAAQAKAKEQEVKALAERPEQGLESAQEIRPPNSFEKWVLKARNRATTKLTEDAPEIAQRSLLSRLLPSFLFVSILTAGCYLMSQYWTRPKQSERLWPNLSLAWATIAGLLTINLAVFFAWRVPGAWKWLNKYFLTVTATPYPPSMLGSMFSHQNFGHLARNMLTLVIFGIPLHEEIGRGNFLPIYLASGLVAGFAGLARYSIQRQFVTTTLGASGGGFGLIAAYLTLHYDSRFSIIFLPKEWADNLNLEGGLLLGALAFFQLVGLVRGHKDVAYLDHLVGMLVGAGSGWWLRQKREMEEQRRKQSGSAKAFWQSLTGSRS